MPSEQRSPILTFACGAALALLIAPGPAHAQSAEPTVQVTAGAVRARNAHEIGIWANSPQASATIRNPEGGFYRTTVRWSNVLPGAYLVTPKGVAEAATPQGGNLLAQVLVPAGGAESWRLDPNVTGSYAFAVSGGRLDALTLARRSGEFAFAMHLGNSGLSGSRLQGALAQYPFPTYTLPGSRDAYKDFVARFGGVRREFGIAGDRHLIIDNCDGRVSKAQRVWIAARLKAFRAQKPRRVFVFMHRPMVDPRPRKHAGMTNRAEVRALQAVLKQGGVTAVFAGSLPIASLTRRDGIDHYVVGPGHALIVRSQPDSITIRKLP